MFDVDAVAEPWMYNTHVQWRLVFSYPLIINGFFSQIAI
jgi:hypothetical protein